MTILVIDGQGGKLGRSLVETIRGEFPEVDLVAVGTNSMATAAMMKGGAVRAATGENPVIVACRSADIIVLDGGTVAATGTHEQLLQTSTIYQEVFYSQTKGGDE